MSEEKRYKTEWTFSFDKLSQDIGEFFRGLNTNGEEIIKQEEFSAPLAGVTSARVRIDFSVGESTVKGLTNLDNLIEADLTYVGEVSFAVSGESEKVVALNQKNAPSDWLRNAIGWIGSQGKLRWDVGLATEIPMQLEVHGGVGKVAVDMRELQVKEGAFYGGAGEYSLTLPAHAEKTVMHVNAGVGEMDIVIPDGANVELTLRGGAGEVELHIGKGANVVAHIDGGVGEIDVHLPVGMAGRIEAQGGIGDIRLNSAFQRLSGSDQFVSKSGVWETPDYAEAAGKLTLVYRGGIGELKVE